MLLNGVPQLVLQRSGFFLDAQLNALRAVYRRAFPRRAGRTGLRAALEPSLRGDLFKEPVLNERHQLLAADTSEPGAARRKRTAT